MTTQMGQVWEEGFDAYFDGKTEDDNPYSEEGSTRDKHRHAEWLRGFRKASEKDD